MALGLQALGPLRLWESLAGSVLFPGHDRYYFSTQYCSMQFRRHETTHAGQLALPALPHPTLHRSNTCRPNPSGL